MIDPKEVLNDLAERLRKAFPGEIKDIVLFGSQLSGEAHEGSDYDFLIVLSGDVNWEREEKISRVCYETDLKFGIYTDLHFLTEDDMNGLRGAQPIFQDAYLNGLKAAA